MRDQTSEKRRFIIATADERLREHLVTFLTSAFAGAVVVSANDGADALFKITNDVPNVLFVDLLISKTPANRVVEWTLENVKDAHISSILIGPVPEREIFVDQIVTGQVQFLPNPYDDDKLKAATFRGLNYSLVDQNAEFNLHYLNTGEILIREGEKAKSVYILKKGRMSAFLKKSKAEVILGQIEPGEFVGEMAYINGEPRNADVRADELCELIEIPIEHLDHVLYTKPAWSRALMRTLSKRVKVANRQRSQAG